MTATSIRPQKRLNGICDAHLLQHHFVFIIQNEYRESSVQDSLFMCFHLIHKPNRAHLAR